VYWKGEGEGEGRPTSGVKRAPCNQTSLGHGVMGSWGSWGSCVVSFVSHTGDAGEQQTGTGRAATNWHLLLFVRKFILFILCPANLAELRQWTMRVIVSSMTRPSVGASRASAAPCARVSSRGLTGFIASRVGS
jgi:hypothetical protein